VISLGFAVAGLRAGRRTESRGSWPFLAALIGLGNLYYVRELPGNQGAQIALALVLACLVCAAAWLPEGRRAWMCLLGAGIALFALMSVTWVWGHLTEDVFDSVNGAAAALLHGHNPYNATFLFITEPAPLTPGSMIGHYGYGPIVPLLAAPGLLLGDIRLMSGVALLAMLAATWYLARQGRHRANAHRILALGLASPFSVGLVYFAFVDVYMMAGLVGWIALRHRHRRWAMVCLAIAMLVKPTALIVLVPAFLWSRRARLEIGLSAAASALFALPFALGVGVPAFLYDVIGIQLAGPPRYETLTMTSFFWQALGVGFPSLIAPTVAATAILLIVWKGRPRDEADLGMQVAVLTLAGLLAAKWAFVNYYFITQVMLLVTLAGAGVGFASHELGLPGRTLAFFRPWIRRRQAAAPAIVTPV
jgi:hypothetical protein